MTRKLCATTLALALVGGVYLTARPAAASNMGFKLEREFAPVEDFRNFFYVSMPLFNGLGDIADTSLGDPCSSTTGDGVVNADDFICDAWTGQEGVFTVERYDIATCSLQTRTARPGFGGGFNFSGTWTDPLPSDEAFQIQQTFPMSGPIQNQAVIVGSHDPSYTGRTLAPNAACRADLQLAFLNIPYHTMYQTADEVLCGLLGVDWDRDPATGDPIWFDLDGNTTVDADEECGAGIYDGTAPMTLVWFDNVADGTGPGGGNTDNSDIARTVRPGFGGGINFSGSNYDLIPGEGYIVQMQPTHSPTTFLSPHF